MIDWESHISLYNWTYELGMNCSSSFKIGLFGSLFFLGVAISTILMKFGDRLGRKNFMVLGGIMSTIDVIALIAIPSINSRYVFMFINGLVGF